MATVRACRLARFPRAGYHRRSRAKDQSALRLRIREIAHARPRFGFRVDVLQDRLVEAQVCDQPLEARVLLLQHHQLAHLVRLEAGVLLLPAVDRLPGHSELSRRLRDWQPQLDLFECPHDLLDRESPLLHGKPLDPSTGSVCRNPHPPNGPISP